jgi:hypothetical protein
MMNSEQTIEYLKGLQIGDRVVETDSTSCLRGREGTVYKGNEGMCVRWDLLPNDEGALGTGLTHGTRRVGEVRRENEFKVWWDREGSGLIPLPGEEASEHCKRVSEIAWRNGAFCELRNCNEETNRLLKGEMWAKSF